jgi:hypothetical protein
VTTIALGLSAEDAARLASMTELYFVLVSLPLLALYLARTYKNVVARPVFLIDRSRSYL